MNRLRLSNRCGVIFVLQLFLVLMSVPNVFAASAAAPGETIDQLYERAKKEGGKVTVYAPFSNRSIEVIPPGFMKRFPGVTVNHVDGTPNQLLARVIAEGRGGKVIADVFGGSLPYLAQITDQKLVIPLALPEAAAYPANMKSNLMAEDRDYQMLVAFAKRKYNSDEKAIDLFKRIAANQPEFHRGHSDLIEFLVAGQQAVCVTCYSHHFPPRVKKGAPIQPLMSEGVGEIGGGVSILKDAPHPAAALLWTRWAVSEEGQRVWAQAGETPAHPHVEPLEKVRPATTYMLGVDDLKEFPRYEKIWKEIFQIR